MNRRDFGQLARLAVCCLLLLVIFHAIFCNEAQLALSDEGRSGDWDRMTSWQRRQYAWTQGPWMLIQTVRRLDPVRLTSAFALCGILIFLGGLRWREALRVQGLGLSLTEITRISFAAHFFNAFLLGSTGGDVWKAYAVARLTHHKKAEAALTVFVDRLVGILALLLFALLFAIPNREFFVQFRRYDGVGLAILGMLFVASVAVVIGLFTDLLGSSSRLGRLAIRFPWMEGPVRALTACRLFGRNIRFLVFSSFLSLLINLAIVGTFVSLAMGLGLHLPSLLLWFVVPAVVCLAALPITPSGLGVRENLFVVLLTVEFPGMGVKPAEALTLSLLGYSMNLAWSVIGGLIYLTVRKGIPVSDADTKPPV